MTAFFVNILKQVYSISEAGIRNYSSGSGVKVPAKTTSDDESQVVTDTLQSDPTLVSSTLKLKDPPESGQEWENKLLFVRSHIQMQVLSKYKLSRLLDDY